MGRLLNVKRRILKIKTASTKLLRKPLTRLKLRRRGSFITSTWTSLILRPILERKWFKSRLVAPVLAAVVAGAVPFTNTHESLTNWEIGESLPEVLTINLVIPSEANQTTSLVPVASLTGISQPYHGGHPGIDLQAPLGSPVIAMRAGKVSRVENELTGYGKHVYVEHSPFLTSMYAHNGKIIVKPGDTVEAGQQIATIGLTGWSTGPHLHFEVYQEGGAVNPMSYLKPELERKAKEHQPATIAKVPANK